MCARVWYNKASYISVGPFPVQEQNSNLTPLVPVQYRNVSLLKQLVQFHIKQSLVQVRYRELVYFHIRQSLVQVRYRELVWVRGDAWKWGYSS